MGSIIPDRKYKWGRMLPKYANAQINPNYLLITVVPVLNNTNKVIIPATALGKRAANSFTPNIFIATTWNQKNKGGFSKKGSKLIWTCKKLLVTIISRAISAKFTSSQSKRLTPPRNGIKNNEANRIISKYIFVLVNEFSIWTYHLSGCKYTCLRRYFLTKWKI